jgi:hypothetical protein
VSSCGGFASWHALHHGRIYGWRATDDQFLERRSVRIIQLRHFLGDHLGALLVNRTCPQSRAGQWQTIQAEGEVQQPGGVVPGQGSARRRLRHPRGQTAASLPTPGPTARGRRPNRTAPPPEATPTTWPAASRPATPRSDGHYPACPARRAGRDRPAWPEPGQARGRQPSHHLRTGRPEAGPRQAGGGDLEFPRQARRW